VCVCVYEASSVSFVGILSMALVGGFRNILVERSASP